MNSYLMLPVSFVKFWFGSAPMHLVSFFFSFNRNVLQLLSLPLLVRTFFKPLKNEYRDGLVGFSVGMGMFVKSLFIIGDLLVFSVLVFSEAIFLVGFFLFPVITVLFPFLIKPI